MTAYRLPDLSRRAALSLMAGGLASGALAACKAKPQKSSAKLAENPAPPLRRSIQHWPTLDALGDKMVKLRFTPGVSLSVMHKGVLLYSRGFGNANIADGAKVTPQSGFRIASVTKQFTAAAILLLQEDGKLSVHDKLSRFMPDFPQSDRVTLAQMMSHTSGMNDYLNHQSQSVLDAAQHRDYTSPELLSVITAVHPPYSAPPGTRWLYSNSAFSLLGLVVERVSGQSLDTFLQSRMFVPAGMTETAIDPSCTAFNGCTGYRPDFRASTGFDTILPISATFGGGAGGIRSTTEDLALWHSALLGGHILKPASLNQMITPMLLNNGKPAWEVVGPEKLNYGFGQGIGKLDGRTFIAHGGRLNGYTSHLRSLVHEQLTVAVLYNCDGTGVPGYTNAQRALRIEAMRLGLENISKA